MRYMSIGRFGITSETEVVIRDEMFGRQETTMGCLVDCWQREMAANRPESRIDVGVGDERRAYEAIPTKPVSLFADPQPAAHKPSEPANTTFSVPPGTKLTIELPGGS